MAMPEQSAPNAAAASTGTIIHRKAATGRAVYQARAMSLAKALRLTFAKVADTEFDMPMAVIGVRREVVPREALDEPLRMDGLRMLFDGPDRVRAGLILNADLVASLIQQQTMGKVIPETSDTPRRLTATDAAVCAPFFQEVLKQASKLPENPEDRQIIAGYRFGVWAEDARLMGMALEAQDYDLIHIDLDLAGGVRQGHLVMCMPQAEVEQPYPDLTVDESSFADGLVPGGAQLSETVLNLEAEVRISLAQARLSLRRLGQLEVGSTLELAQAHFDKVGIQTVEGRTLARGVLGQIDGYRAVHVRATQAKASTGGFDTGGGNVAVAALESPGPNVSDSEGLPPMGEMMESDLPDLPDITGGLDLSEIPDLPETSGLSDLPELPDMSDLPDLPELGDLPDLPELD